MVVNSSMRNIYARNGDSPCAMRFWLRYAKAAGSLAIAFTICVEVVLSRSAKGQVATGERQLDLKVRLKRQANPNFEWRSRAVFLEYKLSGWIEPFRRVPYALERRD